MRRSETRTSDLCRDRMSITTVFKPNASYDISAPPLSPDSQIAEVLDHLIGICFAEPPYLRAENLFRYVSMLHELKGFTVLHFAGPGRETRKVQVGELPINRLASAMKSWVQSYLHRDCHPMLPAHALDTSQACPVSSRRPAPIREGSHLGACPFGLELGSALSL